MRAIHTCPTCKHQASYSKAVLLPRVCACYHSIDRCIPYRLGYGSSRPVEQVSQGRTKRGAPTRQPPALSLMHAIVAANTQHWRPSYHPFWSRGHRAKCIQGAASIARARHSPQAASISLPTHSTRNSSDSTQHRAPTAAQESYNHHRNRH
jgi:hypothetical protein